jgi:spore germination cell wall hydrolase CwlJ-like protein
MKFKNTILGLLCFLTFSTTAHATNTHNSKFLTVVQTNEKVPHYNKTDLFCMAKNIYHEAAYEPKLGKLAVAQVTINRSKDPKFPNSICDVVLEPNQFSWANNHRKQWTKPSGPKWEESKQVAKEAIVEGKRIVGLEHATYYHANYVHPHWKKMTKIAQIGLHIFYKYG